VGERECVETFEPEKTPVHPKAIVLTGANPVRVVVQVRGNDLDPRFSFLPLLDLFVGNTGRDDAL
jgi:hypothetical protein